MQKVVGSNPISRSVLDLFRIATGVGKPIITLHDPETTDALKEIDRAAMADAETDEQVVGVLRYLLEGKLPAAG